MTNLYDIFKTFIILAFIPIVVIAFVCNLVTYGAKRSTFYRAMNYAFMFYLCLYSVLKGAGIL